MAKEDANLDFEPLALDEQRECFRDDPVRVQYSDEDKTNIRTEEEIRNTRG
jgi:hypothetical protein